MLSGLPAEEIRRSIVQFSNIYKERPISNNDGGMGFDHSWATWLILKCLKPALVVESGVWLGHSTWVIEKALPKARIVCFDPNLTRLRFKSSNAEYHSHDFSQHDWSKYDTEAGLCFFDDHQNAYARLVYARWFRFSGVLFEDNPEPGDGDFYSLKHMWAGVGASSLQMNSQLKGTPLLRLRRKLKEAFLKRIGHNQSLLVNPNNSDLKNLLRNIEYFEDVPSVLEFDKSLDISAENGVIRSRRSNQMAFIKFRN